MKLKFSIPVKFVIFTGALITAIMIAITRYTAARERKLVFESFMKKGQILARDINNMIAQYYLKFEKGEKTSLVPILNVINVMKQKNPGVEAISIISRDSVIIAHTDANMLNKRVKEIKGDIKVPLKHKGKVLCYTLIDLSIGVIKEHLKKFWKKMFIFSLIAVIIGMVLAGITGVFIVKPLRSLIKEMEMFDAEKMKEFEIKSPDEAGALSDAINSMLGKIKDKQLSIYKKLNEEMNIVRDVHTRLLPDKIPEVSGFSIEAFYQPAKEVGGDYYDVFEYDNKCKIIIADISGKGVASLPLMAMFHAIVRHIKIEVTEPDELLTLLHQHLKEDMPRGMFITCINAVIDVNTKKMKLCNAGHPSLIYYDSERDKLETIKTKGTPVGVPFLSVEKYKSALEKREIQLKKGDLLFFYTDGIIEAKNPDKEEFGEHRLLDIIKKNTKAPADEIKDKVIESIENFTKGEPQFDDITFIVLKVL